MGRVVAACVLLISSVALGQDKQKDKRVVDEWAAATTSDTLGDVRVIVARVWIGKVTVKALGGGTTESQEPLVQVLLLIQNLSESRKVDYDGWSSKSIYTRFPATCADELGNRYRRIHFGFATEVVFQKTEGESIYPEKSVGDLLIFEVPVKAAKELRFTLPGEAVGETGSFKVKIPVAEPDAKGVIYDAAPKPEPKAKKKAAADKDAPAEFPPKEELSDEEKAAAKQAEEKAKKERDEKAAESKFKAAEALRKAGKADGYRRTLKELVEKYPDTEAGKKAAKLLK